MTASLPALLVTVPLSAAGVYPRSTSTEMELGVTATNSLPSHCSRSPSLMPLKSTSDKSPILLELNITVPVASGNVTVLSAVGLVTVNLVSKAFAELPSKYISEPALNSIP